MSREDDPPDVRMEQRSGTFRTFDGRTVDFSRYGSEGGARVVFHYGTPGTRFLSPQSLGALRRNGVELLVLDRPGYGKSTRRPGRRVVDVVDDIARLVDLHGWARFAVWGGSGGGPHALACAALLPDRVERCACVVGAAPFDAEGLDWFAGMSAGNVEEFTRASAGEESYRPLVEHLASEAVAAAEAGEPQVSADYHLPDADVAALRARLKEHGHLERIRAAYTGGVEGWIDDCIAMTRPWGIDLAQVHVPVSVWYGPDDVLSPRGHAEWLLAHIPNADRQELPLGGHLLGDKGPCCNYLNVRGVRGERRSSIRDGTHVASWGRRRVRRRTP
jgi:pimeloyl-ACP methyl ester carboxylesterase